MTHKETERLITRFLNGDTTMEEEKRLALEVARDDAPEEWKIIAGMIGELTTDEALFDQIMAERTIHRFMRRPKRHWWWAAAACLLLLVGFGFSWIYHSSKVEESPLMAVVPDTGTTASETDIEPTAPSMVTMASETYQNPARVTRFIEELAKVYQADSLRLDCPTAIENNSLESVYLFADNKEQDIIGRLVQVACWYSHKHPGYHLILNEKQLIFQLEDNQKNIHYQWIAERVRGHILLHCSHATGNSQTISACYREFRNEFGNNPFIINNHKTVEI